MNDTSKDRAVQVDVAYVARLARLDLTPAETAQFQSQLGQVLDYVNQLRELDVTGVEPTAHAMPVTNVFRADEPGGPGLDRDEVMANAPASRNGLFMVPRIIE